MGYSSKQLKNQPTYTQRHPNKFKSPQPHRFALRKKNRETNGFKEPQTTARAVNKERERERELGENQTHLRPNTHIVWQGHLHVRVNHSIINPATQQPHIECGLWVVGNWSKLIKPQPAEMVMWAMKAEENSHRIIKIHTHSQTHQSSRQKARKLRSELGLEKLWQGFEGFGRAQRKVQRKPRIMEMCTVIQLSKKAMLSVSSACV